ncbi:hypothetical protein [Mesorhizobium carmichaelinearum]|uniref:hypothetical protein n=1 Tax=Mesorhizobium carmichaelinearum TaxID=1208188 RepID=UPI001180EC9A|nr:hypothetical protein [Mesorhizobium carmichaelinearum]
MKYNITDMIDLAPGAPGLMIPMFRRTGSNLPFVQEMSENFEVVSMMPVMDIESYEFCTEVNDASTDVGEKGIISFRSFDLNVYSMTIQEIFRYRDLNRSKITEDPILDLQLGRICGDPLSMMFDKWNQASPVLDDISEAKRWVAGENRLFQKNDLIWRNVKKFSTEKREEKKHDVSEHGFEFYFRWLNKNYRSDSWQNMWIKAFQINAFEERLIQLGANWLSSQLSTENPVQYFRSVLYIVLERAGIQGMPEDFRRVMTSYVSENPDQIYGLLYPHDFIYYVIINLFGEISEQTKTISDDGVFSTIMEIDKIVGKDDRYSTHFRNALKELEVLQEYTAYFDYISNFDENDDAE